MLKIQEALSIYMDFMCISNPYKNFGFPDFTLGEAARTRLFWQLLLAKFGTSVFFTGSNFHIVDVLSLARGPLDGKELDATDMTAHLYVTMATANIITGSLVSFFLVDRVNRRHCLFAAFSLLTLPLAIILFRGGLCFAWQVQCLGVLYGIYLGGSEAAMVTIYAHAYGTTHLGKIAGSAQAVALSFGGSGPLLFGLTRDLWGSYRPILVFVGVWNFFTCLALLTVPNPMISPRGGRVVDFTSVTSSELPHASIVGRRGYGPLDNSVGAQVLDDVCSENIDCSADVLAQELAHIGPIEGTRATTHSNDSQEDLNT